MAEWTGGFGSRSSPKSDTAQTLMCHPLCDRRLFWNMHVPSPGAILKLPIEYLAHGPKLFFCPSTKLHVLGAFCSGTSTPCSENWCARSHGIGRQSITDLPPCWDHESLAKVAIFELFLCSQDLETSQCLARNTERGQDNVMGTTAAIFQADFITVRSSAVSAF